MKTADDILASRRRLDALFGRRTVQPVVIRQPTEQRPAPRRKPLEAWEASDEEIARYKHALALSEGVKTRKTILLEVAVKHRINVNFLANGRRRFRAITDARTEAIFRLHNEIEINGKPPTTTQIGRWFGGLDHSSVIVALKRARERGMFGE